VFIRPLIAAGCAAVPGLAIAAWSAPLAAAASLATFAAAAIALKVFSGDDLAYLKERFL
jgi:hypothetical protein